MKPINSGNSILNDARISLPLYHGTIERRANEIKEGKTPPVGGPAYVTTNKQFAANHAKNFSHQEEGDKPVVLHIDRNHPSIKGKLKRDPEFGLIKGRPHSFELHGRISPESIIKEEPVTGNPRRPKGKVPNYIKENRKGYGSSEKHPPQKSYEEQLEESMNILYGPGNWNRKAHLGHE